MAKKQTKAAATKRKGGKQYNYERLRIFNLVMGFLHIMQGAIMLIVSSDFKLPINSSFIQFNAMTQKLEPVIDTLYELQIGPVVAAFLFMSSLAHFLLTMPRIYEWYIGNLKKGVNFARWMEYSISSSVMIVIIAMLVGIYDVASLILIFSINACMILFGWLMELINIFTKKTNWLAYWFGSFAGIVPWICIAFFLAGAGSGDAQPPTFVYYIFFSIFIFFNTFAINMILQYKKIGPWKNYNFGEAMYILLSLVAKSLLAWQVWAGTLRPE